MSIFLEPEHEECNICTYYAKPQECDCHPEKNEYPYNYCCCRGALELLRWKDHKVANELILAASTRASALGTAVEEAREFCRPTRPVTPLSGHPFETVTHCGSCGCGHCTGDR